MIGPPGGAGAVRPRTAPGSNRRIPNDSNGGLNPLLNPGESARRTALNEDDLLVFGALALAAHRGLPCPSTAEILTLLPHRRSDSTPPGILAKLERAKLIRHIIFQRGRAVQIIATGACTAKPSNLVRHWRHRAPANAGEPGPILSEHWFREPELRGVS